MRIKRLEVSGFRGFARRADLDFDADVVLLSGPNGSGKTSVFDAFLWALTGRIGRLSERPDHVTSCFSESGEAFVALTLSSPGEEEMRISRTISRGTQQDRLLVETAQTRLEDSAAVDMILRRLWPAALASEDPMSAFSTALTRSVYLQQDVVRDLLARDTEENRFKVLSELVGTGRLTELIRALEAARNRWSRSGSKDAAQLKEVEDRLAALSDRAARLSKAKDETGHPDATLLQWWTRVGQIIPSFEAGFTGLAPSGQDIDRALKQVEVHRRLAERSLAGVRGLLDDLQKAPRFEDEQAKRAATLRALVSGQTADLKAKRAALEVAEQEAAAERRRLTELRLEGEELAALAQLALRHLAERCPVCNQRYDRAQAEKRLKGQLHPEAQKIASSVLNRPAVVAREIEMLEGEMTEARRELASIDALQSRSSQWEAILQQRMRELRIDGGVATLPEQLARMASDHERRLAHLLQIQREGESLALQTARTAEAAQRHQLELTIASIEQELAELRADVSAHSRTHQVASEIIQGAREVAWDVVREQIDRIGPSAERIYSRIDPHPILTDVAIRTETSGQRGKVAVRVADRLGAGLSLDPNLVLSSSQLNGLAVALFLAFGLAVRDGALECLLLDDPLQSLDDVNLLGLVDVFRRVKDRRQVVLSTHDRRFAALLQRKLRPIAENQRTLQYVFEEWTLGGPTTTAMEVAGTPAEILVAA